MNPNEMIDEIEKLFPDARCELVHENEFQLLCAVILSAQTTDAAVNRLTPALFKAYPDCYSMAQAEPEEVEEYIKSLGLFHNKARSLVQSARVLVEQFDGIVPSEYEDLEKLPGVGRKTANVVRSVAYDIPSLAVDTHVERVSKRLGLASVESDVSQVEQALMEKIDRSRWNRTHHELIFFGRYLCTARNPQCSKCPFQGECFKEELEIYKAQKKKQEQKRRIRSDRSERENYGNR